MDNKRMGILLILSLFITLNAKAQTKVVNICVKKQGTVFFKAAQFDVLAVDGVSSRRSTFWYKGQNSKLKLDFHQSKHITAACHSAGSDLYKIQFRVNGTRNIQTFMARVNCIHCVKSTVLKRKDRLVGLGLRIQEIRNPELVQKLREQMLKQSKKLLELIEKELKKEDQPEEVIEQLEQMKLMVEKLLAMILEGDVQSEHFTHLLSQLNSL